MEYFDWGVNLANVDVRTNYESQKWHVFFVEGLLVERMILDVDIVRIYFEERMRVVPPNQILPLFLDLLPGQIS